MYPELQYLKAALTILKTNGKIKFHRILMEKDCQEKREESGHISAQHVIALFQRAPQPAQFAGVGLMYLWMVMVTKFFWCRDAIGATWQMESRDEN